MTGEWAWRLPFLLQMVPSLVLGVGIMFLPFSPRWLVSKSRDFEAGKSLSKLRQLDISDRRVQQEWIDIRAEVAFHREVSVIRHPDLQDGTAKSRIKLEVAAWSDCKYPSEPIIKLYMSFRTRRKSSVPEPPPAA